jgi:GDP-L-fucose synthase
MNKSDRILVAGARGLVGSHLVAALRERGHNNLLVPTHAELDWADPVAAKWYFSVHEPEYVFLCAAKVGGIKANIDQPVEFLLKNLAIQNNVMSNAAEYGTKKLLFLGSSCVYPRDCPQPIKEEYLLTGPFEKAVEAYGLAKVCGTKLAKMYHEAGHCFVSAMPCNLFGPGDNFSEHTGHVVPGMMARMHLAKLENAEFFPAWGLPTTKREFLYAADLAEALIVIMEKYHDAEPINAGSGIEISINELAYVLQVVTGYGGEIRWDTDQPVGTPRKIMDNSKLRSLGWTPKTLLGVALKSTYDWFRLNQP